MKARAPAFAELLKQSIRDPASAAAEILSLGLPRSVLWQGLILVSSLGTVTTALAQGLFQTVPIGPEGAILLTPLAYFLLLGLSLLIMAGTLAVTGRLFGGTGRFDGALALAIWFEIIAIAVSLLQLIAALLLPPLALIVTLAGFGVLFWCLLHFTNALHRFASLGKSLLTMILAFVLSGVVVALIAGLAGGAASLHGA